MRALRVSDKVEYREVKENSMGTPHEVLAVLPHGIPSCREPMVKLANKPGYVLASHCTLIKKPFAVGDRVKFDCISYFLEGGEPKKVTVYKNAKGTIEELVPIRGYAIINMDGDRTPKKLGDGSPKKLPILLKNLRLIRVKKREEMFLLFLDEYDPKPSLTDNEEDAIQWVNCDSSHPNSFYIKIQAVKKVKSLP